MFKLGCCSHRTDSIDWSSERQGDLRRSPGDLRILTDGIAQQHQDVFVARAIPGNAARLSLGGLYRATHVNNGVQSIDAEMLLFSDYR